MIEIVLVNPLLESVGGGDHVLKSAFHTPPEGLCYLASRVRADGRGVAIIDSAALGLSAAETVKEVLDKRPRIVGLTATTISIQSAAVVKAYLKGVHLL
jgi:hypothetical protein